MVDWKCLRTGEAIEVPAAERKWILLQGTTVPALRADLRGELGGETAGIVGSDSLFSSPEIWRAGATGSW